MTTNQPATTLFVLQDLVTGKYRPERLGYTDAKAAADADGFLKVRRLDEVLAETGRVA